MLQSEIDKQQRCRGAIGSFRLCLAAFFVLLAACATSHKMDPDRTSGKIVATAQKSDRGTHLLHTPDGVRERSSCALDAFNDMASSQMQEAQSAAVRATACTRAWLSSVLKGRTQWAPGLMEDGGVAVEVVLRDVSPNLATSFQIIPSDLVPMGMYWGARKTKSGFGVPVVLMSPRCRDRPACKLLPPSGVARTATAWLEPAPGGGSPRLVLGHPIRTRGVYTGYNYWPLAEDSSAFYAAALADSPIRRLSIWNLLGGREMGRRAGVYLLEDYDPNKRTLVMIHGLGSSPVTWARLSNAIWADPILRANYQVWQVVYETNEPILVGRHRVERHLDAAWEMLDPPGTSAARRNIVLLGHSMGGAISRLLMIDSKDEVWSAAFAKPVSALAGSSNDLRALEGMFRFAPYPGVRRGIFLAAPHQGSPTAGSFVGRTVNRLVGRRSPELTSLRRVAAENESAVPPSLRSHFLEDNINSISTLRGDQPVMAAARALTIPCGTAFHTIAGRRPGKSPPGDGIVPLESAILPGAASTLVIEAGHNVHEYDEAIAEVIRILHEDMSSGSQPRCDTTVAGDTD